MRTMSISSGGTQADFFKELALQLNNKVGFTLETDIDEEYLRIQGDTSARMTIVFSIPNMTNKIVFQGTKGYTTSSPNSNDALKIFLRRTGLSDRELTSAATFNITTSYANANTEATRTVNIVYNYVEGNFILQIGRIDAEVPYRGGSSNAVVSFACIDTYLFYSRYSSDFTVCDSNGNSVNYTICFNYNGVNDVDYIKSIIITNPQKINALTNGYSTSNLTRFTDYDLSGEKISMFTENLGMKTEE